MKTAVTLSQIANALVFTSLLIAGGVIFWLMPQQTVSEDENRTLKSQPVLTVDNVMAGKFGKAFEEYYNDHFPWRNEWLAFADGLKSLKGLQNQEFKVVETHNTPANAMSVQPDATHLSDNLTSSTLENATSAIAGTNLTASSATAPTLPIIDDDEFSKFKGVVISNGRVIQNFGGSKATVTPFADMLNRYRQVLPYQVKLYALVAPAGSDFYLPRQVNDGVMREKQSIDWLNSMLDPTITPVNAYDEIAPHKEEYIMFRTDHHWTGLGAYYAYVAFAKQAGIIPQALSDFNHITRDVTFLGSLYNYTHDNDLKKNPDTLEYYKQKQDYKVTVYTKGYNKADVKEGKNGMNMSLYAERNNGYSVFLGGDFPLLKITKAPPPLAVSSSPAIAPIATASNAMTKQKTVAQITPTNFDNPNARKILVIKDSFGNAFSTYLPPHYDEVYVVDYRYFKGSIASLVRDMNIQEVVYVHNTFAINSKASAQYGMAMLN